MTTSEDLLTNKAEPPRGDVSSGDDNNSKEFDALLKGSETLDRAKVYNNRDRLKYGIAAFGWFSEDIIHLQKEYPNVTQRQLTEYMSTLFNKTSSHPRQLQGSSGTLKVR